MLIAHETHADNTDADNADAEEADVGEADIHTINCAVSDMYACMFGLPNISCCALPFALSNCELKLSRKQQQFGSSRGATVSSPLTLAVLV